MFAKMFRKILTINWNLISLELLIVQRYKIGLLGSLNLTQHSLSWSTLYISGERGVGGPKVGWKWERGGRGGG